MRYKSGWHVNALVALSNKGNCVIAEETDLPHDSGPAGGWGSMQGMARILGESHASPMVLRSLRRQNKPKGVMCTSCAWPKPANYSAFEFCENGAKATMWELTSARCKPEFWADDAHTVTALRDWEDHDLELTGRLTHPLRYNAATDRYEAVSWEDAFAAIGAVVEAAAQGKRGVLRLGTRRARSLVPLRVAGAHLRQQQPAAKFQHVP